jgi:Uma2 family endonuclease
MTTTLKLKPIVHLNREQFARLCQANPEARLELTQIGELVVMPPTGGETGDRNDEISFQLRAWNKLTLSGKTFDSSTGFNLPNGATRSPDASWVSLTCWNALTEEERKGFPPLCPDFIVELRSSSDNLKALRDKMQEYIDNGTQLGWLIDPIRKIVEIYRTGQQPEVLPNPIQLSGENVLPGFVLDLESVF